MLGVELIDQAVKGFKSVEGTRDWDIEGMLEAKSSDGKKTKSSERPKRSEDEELGSWWKLMMVKAMTMTMTQRERGRVSKGQVTQGATVLCLK